MRLADYRAAVDGGRSGAGPALKQLKPQLVLELRDLGAHLWHPTAGRRAAGIAMSEELGDD